MVYWDQYLDIKEKINGVTKGSIAFEPEHPIPAQIVRKKKKQDQYSSIKSSNAYPLSTNGPNSIPTLKAVLESTQDYVFD